MSGINIQVRIAEISEHRFFIQAPPATITVENVRKEVVFKAGLNIVQLIETGQLGVVMDTKILLRSEQNKILMHSIVQVNYDIGGIDMLAGIEDPNLASVPVEVAQSLVAATYSTVRGILHLRCAGSLLQLLTLPLTDPMAFLDGSRIKEGITHSAPPLPE